MAIDIERMLHRVVGDVFDEDTDVQYDVDLKPPRLDCVRLSDGPGKERNVEIRATYEWVDAHILDMDVSTILFDYDDDEGEKELLLRELALVVRAYLRGEGHIEYRHSLLRRRPVPVLTVTVNDREWKLGRRVGVVPYP